MAPQYLLGKLTNHLTFAIYYKPCPPKNEIHVLLHALCFSNAMPLLALLLPCFLSSPGHPLCIHRNAQI